MSVPSEGVPSPIRLSPTSPSKSVSQERRSRLLSLASQEEKRIGPREGGALQPQEEKELLSLEALAEMEKSADQIRSDMRMSMRNMLLTGNNIVAGAPETEEAKTGAAVTVEKEEAVAARDGEEKVYWWQKNKFKLLLALVVILILTAITVVIVVFAKGEKNK